MVTREDNELLTRVGSGTPMGNLMRLYWIPAFMSTELVPDGDPMRLRLLGEDLVAFRSTTGEVGVVEEHCPHRGASLFLGRNEECGLRCVYHGWKFDVAGKCVDMPNEPPDSRFKDRIQHVAYKTFEQNGVVWLYMGSESTPPALPKLGWSLVPESHYVIDRRYQACNFVQALEGGVDNSHVAFLHRTSESLIRAKVATVNSEDHPANLTGHPRFETVDRDYGVAIAAQRDVDVETFHWHITHFLMPFHTMLAGNNPCSAHAFVPMDDQHTVMWTMTWNPIEPLAQDHRENLTSGRWIHSAPSQLLPATTEPEGAFRPIGRRSNDWLIDREAARTTRFMGVPYFWLQDQAVQESMGPIYDRRREHLGTSDLGVIRVRRFWKKAVENLQKGTLPSSLSSPDSYFVHGADIALPKDIPWVEGAKERVWPTNEPA